MKILAEKMCKCLLQSVWYLRVDTMLCVFFSWLVYLRPSSLLRQFLWRILRQCFSLWSSGILFWRLWNLIRLSIGMGFAEIMNFILGDLFFSRSSRSRDSTSKREALVGWTSRSVDVHRFKRVYRCERDGRRRIWRVHNLQAGPHQLFFKVTSEQFRASSLLLLVRCRSHSNPAELTDERRRSRHPTW